MAEVRTRQGVRRRRGGPVGRDTWRRSTDSGQYDLLMKCYLDEKIESGFWGPLIFSFSQPANPDAAPSEATTPPPLKPPPPSRHLPHHPIQSVLLSAHDLRPAPASARPRAEDFLLIPPSINLTPVQPIVDKPVRPNDVVRNETTVPGELPRRASADRADSYSPAAAEHV